MNFIFADRVKETTTTTGTGTVNLGGAASGFIDFDAVMANGDICYYCIALGTEWEVGIGTFTSGSPDTLARTRVLSSSNSNSAVNFSAGTKDVFMVSAADFHVNPRRGPIAATAVGYDMN
jgi:hypothetical protein